MNDAEYAALKPGDLVRNKGTGTAMIVVEVVSGVPVLARYTTMHNPSEWERVNVSGKASLAEQRPDLCRSALRDAGKPYPRSGCAVCRNGGMMGCPYERKAS